MTGEEQAVIDAAIAMAEHWEQNSAECRPRPVLIAVRKLKDSRALDARLADLHASGYRLPGEE